MRCSHQYSFRELRCLSVTVPVCWDDLECGVTAPTRIGQGVWCWLRGVYAYFFRSLALRSVSRAVDRRAVGRTTDQAQGSAAGDGPGHGDLVSPAGFRLYFVGLSGCQSALTRVDRKSTRLNSSHSQIS